MSAFLVADETINRVVEWLYLDIEKCPFLKEKLKDTLVIVTTRDQWSVQLGKTMFALNIDGVESGYGAGEAKRFRELNYRFAPTHGSKVQVLKSLQCWLYQCMERDMMQKPLYRLFREVVEPHLMSSIINDLPKYNSAVWG